MQFIEVLRLMFVEIDRVQAERGIQAFVCFDQELQPLPIALRSPEHHHALHAERPAAREPGVAVGVEVGEVEVGMGVDQVHEPSFGDFSGRCQAWIRLLPVMIARQRTSETTGAP